MTIMCTMQKINESLNIDDRQDARFALDKDEQTTFIDSQGKLNPKAVKWSEVRKKQAIGKDLCKECFLKGAADHRPRPALPHLCPLQVDRDQDG